VLMEKQHQRQIARMTKNPDTVQEVAPPAFMPRFPVGMRRSNLPSSSAVHLSLCRVVSSAGALQREGQHDEVRTSVEAQLDPGRRRRHTLRRKFDATVRTHHAAEPRLVEQVERSHNISIDVLIDALTIFY
jgi:hypothetical protein